MSIQVRTCIEVGDSDEDDSRLVRIDAIETVILADPDGPAEDLIALTQAALDRQIEEVGAAARDQVRQLHDALRGRSLG